jgi:hypothetical protein
VQQYDNTNSGALFRNNDKEKENDRDYSGTLDVDGVEYWLSGWVRTSKKSGAKFLSLKVKPKNAQAKKSAAGADDFDDDAPF